MCTNSRLLVWVRCVCEGHGSAERTACSGLRVLHILRTLGWICFPLHSYSCYDILCVCVYMCRTHTSLHIRLQYIRGHWCTYLWSKSGLSSLVFGRGLSLSPPHTHTHTHIQWNFVEVQGMPNSRATEPVLITCGFHLVSISLPYKSKADALNCRAPLEVFFPCSSKI